MNKFLDESMRRQLRELFHNLDQQVTLLFLGSPKQNCAYCQDTVTLLQEVEELSPKVIVQVHNLDEEPELEKTYQVEMTPCVILGKSTGGHFNDSRVRFYGIPAGHLFNVLIRSIQMVSSGKTDLRDEMKSYLREVKTPLHFQVFVTPYCPHCPKAVQLVHQMALENELVRSEMIETREFQEFADANHVSGVPHTVVNHGAGHITGALSELQFLDQLKQLIHDN
jgi:glutaredoxin-like protein